MVVDKRLLNQLALAVGGAISTGLSFLLTLDEEVVQEEQGCCFRAAFSTTCTYRDAGDAGDAGNDYLQLASMPRVAIHCEPQRATSLVFRVRGRRSEPSRSPAVAGPANLRP